MSEERAYWSKLVEDLQGLMTVHGIMTIAKIAELIGVEPRQVWRMKAGEDRPKGIVALNLYLLHMKHCPERQRPESHSQEALKG